MTIEHHEINELELKFNHLRNDFPIFNATDHKKPIIYFDSASSTQKPNSVIEAVSQFYKQGYANIHRGIYELSESATNSYEQVRKDVADFINAKSQNEIVFVRSTTEGINLIATCFGQRLQANDEIILTMMEHHANIVPWLFLKEQKGIKLKVIPINKKGELDLEKFKDLISPKTKMISFTHVSNVLGTVNPIKEMVSIAKANNIPVLIDGAQAVARFPIDVQAIDCDFYIFSSHKLYGPTGVGVVYAKNPWLFELPPYQGGGSMIETVTFEKATYADPPQKFEAGTQDIASVIGFGAAIKYVQSIGMDAILQHELQLLNYAKARLQSFPNLEMIGDAKNRIGVISFVIKNIHAHDLGTILSHEGIAIRAGHHCAMPLMQFYNVPAVARISFGIYNAKSDIDLLMDALTLSKRLFA